MVRLPCWAGNQIGFQPLPARRGAVMARDRSSSDMILQFHHAVAPVGTVRDAGVVINGVGLDADDSNAGRVSARFSEAQANRWNPARSATIARAGPAGQRRTGHRVGAAGGYRV